MHSSQVVPVPFRRSAQNWRLPNCRSHEAAFKLVAHSYLSSLESRSTRPSATPRTPIDFLGVTPRSKKDCLKSASFEHSLAGMYKEVTYAAWCCYGDCTSCAFQHAARNFTKALRLLRLLLMERVVEW